MTDSTRTALVWLRRDLRLFDHAALHYALTHFSRVIPVFVFDTTILSHLPRQDRRVAFIWHSLQELKQALRSRGSDLVVVHGDPRIELPRLARSWKAKAVVCNRDYEPEAIARDRAVEQALDEMGIAFHSFKDQVIFEQNEVLTQTGGMYSVFTPYKRAWLKRYAEAPIQSYDCDTPAQAFAQLPPQAMHELAQLGFDAVEVSALRPGMSGGQALFDDFVGRIDHYKEWRDYPATKGVSYLSVHLRFGTVSIRHLARTAYQIGGAGAETWLSELIWREFYHQLLWHRPDVVEQSFKAEYASLTFPNDRDWFDAWCRGETGFPIVDAAMRQLNQTGYMHNRLRMITASFLVKDCLVDWRWGEQYFALHLNDFDLAANNGGWQWAASTGCDAQPYFRIFNPVTQSERFDPNGKFIRKYCPELSRVSDKAIHAPWLAKPAELGGVVIGRDYPAPILDHAHQREQALALFKVK